MKKKELYKKDEDFIERLFASEANKEIIEDLSLK